MTSLFYYRILFLNSRSREKNEIRIPIFDGSKLLIYYGIQFSLPLQVLILYTEAIDREHSMSQSSSRNEK
jgi:hypothetical protein